MKAALFKNKGDIEFQDTAKPKIQDPLDAIVKIKATSICGTDMHMYHGLVPFEKNHILGHEFVGIVEEVGNHISRVKPGDRVVGTSTIACGWCFYCKMGYYGQCDNANSNKSSAYFGSPAKAGGYQGVQAEYVRVPYADTVLYKLPDEITDEQAVIMSDIFPTGYFAADMAEIKPGESVAIYGAGPVGQMAAFSAKIMGASRIFIIDEFNSRLKMAQEHANAIPINFSKKDPVKEIMKATNNDGVDKAIEAVGVEAHTGLIENIEETLNLEQSPAKTLRWAIESVRKCGVVSVVGVFSGNVNNFPIGTLMERNITFRAGVCHHRKYMETIANLIKSGQVDPTYVLTHRYKLKDIDEAYEMFDKEKNKCVKELIEV
ncbi:MAG: hypothetical protein A2Y25_09720 [Candidatus Melainabacteria bacterium GWF2_37_15]|nr:MAG: hypothetical protein A2Y25_09720 [Candidatus Melainabacteria bacterium GWF2_37_15]